MDQEHVFSGVISPPNNVLETAAISPPPATAYSGLAPSPERVRRWVCPPDHTFSNSPTTADATPAACENYTYPSHSGSPGADSKSYNLGFPYAATRDAPMFDSHWRSNNAVPRQPPDSFANDRGTALFQGPAISTSIPDNVSPQPSPYSTDYDDVGSAASLDGAISGIRLEEDAGLRAKRGLKLAEASVAAFHPIRGITRPEDPEPFAVLAARHGPTRTRPANSAENSSAGHSVDFSEGSGHEDESDQDGENSIDGESDNETEDDGEKDRGGSGDNKITTSGLQISNWPLSCPYRKRNMQRFNVLDHPKCAKPFKNLSRVKSHISECHWQKVIRECPRCWQQFDTPTDSARHRKLLTSGQMCAPTGQPQRRNRPYDVEDGIPDAIATLLSQRKGHLKISTWEILWGKLFPEDNEVPSSMYEPYIKGEKYEVMGVTGKAWARIEKDVTEQILLGNGHWTSPNTIALQLMQPADSVFKEMVADGLRNLEHPIQAKARLAVSGPARSRSRKSTRRQDQGNHGPGGRVPHSGIHLDHHGGQQVQRQRLLAPSPIGGVAGHAFPSSSPILQPNSPTDFLRQGYRGPGPFLPPAMAGLGDQPWPPETTLAGSVIGWPNDNSAQQVFSMDTQHAQSPTTGPTNTYPSHPAPFTTNSLGTSNAHRQDPATYGPHPQECYLHTAFWPNPAGNDRHKKGD